MRTPGASGGQPDPLDLLDAGLTWARECIELARSRPPDTPTPCARWDLATLLRHVDDGLVALTEAADLGQVSVDPLPTRGTEDLVDLVLARGCALREHWRGRRTSAPVTVGGLALGRNTVLVVGALEAAVHGWDVARACGASWEVPEDLAAKLYDMALAVVPEGERGRRFAQPVSVPGGAGASTLLLAHLGRRADWMHPAGVDASR